MNLFNPRKLGIIAGITISFASLISTQSVLAHSEHDKGRFVAESGKDTGRCDNRFRPCRTIAYAAAQANKGDIVMVAEGNYSIDASYELMVLSNDIVPVRGGYSTADHFQVQNPSTNATFLTGIPLSFTAKLYQQGFNAIGDGKNNLSTEDITALESATFSLQSAQPKTDCVDSKAGPFSCQNISLLANLLPGELHTNATSANDVWGHVDLNTGKEYAIIGLRNGVSVVDVSNPTKPSVVGSIGGQPTTWRDIKVFQRYESTSKRWQAWAYVTADNASDGLLIIDLNDLANGISLASRDRTDSSAHNVYISGVDYTLNIANSDFAPQVNILGANNFGGALRSYSLKRPDDLTTTFVPSKLTRDDYTHDASSLMITDSRADVGCPKATDGKCVLLLDFNENSLRLWDHSTGKTAVQLSDTTYGNARYTHSGWWSEDRQYVFLHDELDEQSLALNTQLYVFDISTLSAPQLVATWEGPTRAVDHNGFVRGNRYYMSNYERGLTILDISNPLSPQEVGYFDTYPASNNGSFNGAWGVYPYLPSGNVLVSDIQRGLFILTDETLTNDTTIGFENTHIRADEGTSAQLNVVKQGEGAMTVQYSVILGSASEVDAVIADGELTWAAGSASTQTISLPLNSDVRQEGDEIFFVTLHTPKDGYLDPASRIATLTINGSASQAGQPVFNDTAITVRENQTSFDVSLMRTGGSAGELRIPLSFAEAKATNELTLAQNEVVWADGNTDSQTVQITLVDDSETESNETYTLVAGTSSTSITIRDDESNQLPSANAGEDMSVNARATVTLRGTGTDPENNPLNVLWTQSGGSAVSITNATSQNSQFVAPDQAATLRFTLTVTDEFGAQASDEVVVTVAAPTPAPTPTPPPAQSSGGGGSLSYWLVALLALGTMGRRVKVRRGR